ncbi:MAG: hypothetical protein Q8916_06390 [Bacteroidota bacterium]|nr:hypothetical protein [Bacteroidota bacterium]MDP4230019.1 hypothetical protein [Bacteroidota bacterium]MDP4234828.1 hypothetical protein [Bacteroidota bacterium]
MTQQIFLLLVLITISFAQNPVTKIRDKTKQINLTVGSAIDNEGTRKALKAMNKIPEVAATIRRYNRRFGNDSVQAKMFVDREPDEKAQDSLMKNYYEVVVVSDSANQTSRWFAFFVRKDYQEILFYDLKQSKTGGIDDWKKIWPASEFATAPKRKY